MTSNSVDQDSGGEPEGPEASHVFISYAHIDNSPEEGDGWVTRFHRKLKDVLGMRLGKSARIWRDEKLDGNDIFDEEIDHQYADSTVFASVLTPRYVESDWCRREAAGFCAVAEREGNLRIGNKCRAFKVVLLPPQSQDELPDPLKRSLGYEFFVKDGKNNLPLDPKFEEELFRRRLHELAADMVRIIKLVESPAKKPKLNSLTPASMRSEMAWLHSSGVPVTQRAWAMSSALRSGVT